MTPAGIFIRGLAMGIADAVPGVSGGTIAFLTGIYPRWLAVLTGIHPRLIILLRQGRFRALWVAIDGGFVVPLLAGIALSLISVAHLITYGLSTWPGRIWGLFFGLVILMGWGLVQRLLPHFRWSMLGWFSLGLLIAALLALLQPVSLQLAWWGWPLVGGMALSAMLLPGISGSFLLVLVGVYPQLMTAVTVGDWQTLGLFGIGGVAGLLLMAHLLRWLMARMERILLSFLTGVVFGALVRIWPWQVSGPEGQLVLQWPTVTTWLEPSVWILVGGLLGLGTLIAGNPKHGASQ